MEKVHFISLGCPKNLVDSEIMVGHLMKEGYQIVPDSEGADTVIVNTCGFIDDAKDESISKIIEMGELKKKGKLSKVVVAGCLTQRYKDQLVEELPEADIFIGSGEFHKVPEILNSKEKKDFFYQPTFLQDHETPRVNSQPFYRAYLKISEGCKKRCSFCAIPKIRGNLQSRNVDDIVNEAKLLVAGGVREVIVISHDFSDYGWDLRRKEKDLTDNSVELLRALSDVEGLDWIRVLYMYPDGITPELIQLMKEKENLVKYFDMPLQHVNNEMLARMNRKMTREQICEVIQMIRKEIPEAVIRTQFIVGFPGETEEHFDELMDFVEEQRFDRVGCFQYSIEDNTPAGKMDDQIEDEVKQDRHDRLMEMQQGISNEIHEKYLNRVIPVLIEGYSEETDLLLQGRTSQQAPEIDGVVYINDGTAKVGEIVPVRITESLDYDLIGAIEPQESD